MAKATKVKKTAPKKTVKKSAQLATSKTASRTRKKNDVDQPSTDKARRSSKTKSQAWERGEAIECAPTE